MTQPLETVQKCIEQLKRKTEGEARALVEIVDAQLPLAIEDARRTSPSKNSIEALEAIRALFGEEEPKLVVAPMHRKDKMTNGLQDRIDAAFSKLDRVLHDYRVSLAPEQFVQQAAAERDPQLTSQERRY